jgi:hypothetical protein
MGFGQRKCVLQQLGIGFGQLGTIGVKLGAMLLGACRMLAIAILDWADEERLL